MTTIVLRVRLLGGERADLTHEDPGQDDEGGMVEQAVEVLRAEPGALRCRHGDRMVVLYARGVDSLEVSPRRRGRVSVPRPGVRSPALRVRHVHAARATGWSG